MTYTLPAGHSSASTLDFSNAAPMPKRLFGVLGRLMSMEPGQPATILCFRARRGGTGGSSGDKKARWRIGRGLGHGMRSTKFIVAKTAGGH